MVRELANNQAKWGGAAVRPLISILSNDFNELAFLRSYCIH